MHETTRATFMTLLQDIPSSMPLLFLAAADVEWRELPESIQDLFSSINDEVRILTVKDNIFGRQNAQNYFF